MGFLGNLIWFLFSGLWQGLGWSLAGLLWCVTIVGIPIGMQCFKIAGFVLFPFGKEIRYSDMGVMSAVANVFWIIFSGIPLALSAIVNGVLLCLTIVGIPFGLQCFKFAKLALMPFGSRVYSM